MRILALVRDVAPVVGVMLLALFVLWQGAERRQQAEVERDRGAASHVQSDVQSVAEPQRTERAVASRLALPAGLGISALAVVFSVAHPGVRRRARQWRA